MSGNEASRRRGVLFAVTATQFAVPFMLSAIAVALPVIGHDFGARAVELGLVESAYIATASMLLLPFARASDMFGRGFVFVCGVTTFTVASLLLALAQSIELFIGLRVLQGVGSSAQIATGLAIISEVFPREERGRAIGLSVAGVYVGLSAGPYLGGLVTTHLGWRWVFLLGMAACLVALIMAVRGLDVHPRKGDGTRFDWGGLVTSAAGFGLVVFGSAEWGGVPGKVMVLCGLALLGVFAWWERRAEAPLLDMGLLATNRSFAYASAVQFINYAATFGVTFLTSLYLQTVLGMTPGQAGALLIVQPLVMASLAPVSGRMADRLPPHRVATVGMALGTLGLLLALRFGPSTEPWWVMLVLAFFGMGTALFATPNMSVIMGSVTPRHYAMASAMTGGMRTAGMTASIVCIGFVLSSVMGDAAVSAATSGAYLRAMHVALSGFVMLSAVGVLLSLRAPMPERAE
ncbi:MFS family permease [Desulfobaculum xiamenense]|uniref:MFS family permease n=1 Tax=Desulfobaculum xiamenense TaxID=995050 RepID=A0A846QLT1_9BACT|nr:MFS transporter [Desulfobaculum xiamenense]NJB68147.1 MFS family permease [Desulfobaculum xiamenense]